MKIGELAASAGTTAETIRHYEREGLLTRPPRSAGNYRLYTGQDAERLALIRHCRSLDMTLDEIRTLLQLRDAPGEDCGEVNALLDEHIAHVDARIRDLRQLQRQLRQLREQCAVPRDVAHCGILVELAQPSGPVPAHADECAGHVRGAHAHEPRRRGTTRT